MGGPLHQRLRDDRWAWFRRVRVEPEETQGSVHESGLALGRREGRGPGSSNHVPGHGVGLRETADPATRGETGGDEGHPPVLEGDEVLP